MTTFNVLLAVIVGAALAFIPQGANWICSSPAKGQTAHGETRVLLKAAEGAAYISDVIASY